MCELLGISSNRPTGWGEVLTLFRERGGRTADNPDGWGMAWRDAGAWQLHKAPEAAFRSERYAALSPSIRTDLLIAHVRKANPPSPFTLQNTHPFLRDCCGRQWVFAHNGKVPEVIHPQGCCHPTHSQPKGQTDSEHAFYFLLEEIVEAFNHSHGALAWTTRLAQLSGDIACYGQFNFLMANGDYLFAYGHDRLHRLSTSTRGERRMLIASEPLTQEAAWEAFLPGELLVLQAGQLVDRIQTAGTVSNACAARQGKRSTP